jgi:serine/threonine protein kinase
VGKIYKLIDMDVGRSFEQIYSNKANEKIEIETLKGYDKNEMNLMKFSVRGTVPWMSPELSQAMKRKCDKVLGDPYRSDMFSVGILLIQLCYCNIKINAASHTHKQLMDKASRITTLGYS